MIYRETILAKSVFCLPSNLLNVSFDTLFRPMVLILIVKNIHVFTLSKKSFGRDNEALNTLKADTTLSRRCKGSSLYNFKLKCLVLFKELSKLVIYVYE